MPRTARIVIPGIPYHITQRGNNRQQVYYCDADYRNYLNFLKQYARQYGFAVLGYCLMPNHCHVVGIPKTERSLAQAFGYTHTQYTQQINKRLGQSGHLWQDRFFSCPMDDPYLIRALRYVERNPVRAHLVASAWDYPWSSASVHVGGVDRFGILDVATFAAQWDSATWREYLTAPDENIDVDAIRRQTATGIPLGDATFQERIKQARG